MSRKMKQVPLAGTRCTLSFFSIVVPMNGINALQWNYARIRSICRSGGTDVKLKETP